MSKPWARLQALWQHWRSHAPWTASAPTIPDTLWQQTLHDYPFLQQLSHGECMQLRQLCQVFLQRKQFTGAEGLEITDAMALAIAAQACVLLLHWGSPRSALRWYDDFVGIVVYPHDMQVRRTVQDAAGVVHHLALSLQGEAMERGPITLSWSAVQQPARFSAGGHQGNVVIHEFAHKLDMANGDTDGCPPLPVGFMGLQQAAQAKQLWQRSWTQAYAAFVDNCLAHERFGQPAPWLDPYAATDPAEFFAVACEAYWLAPHAFAQALPTLHPLLDALFQRQSLRRPPDSA